MFQSILELWRELPWIIKIPLDFFILFIFLRGVVADDITTWLKDRNIIRKGNKSVIYRGLDFMYDSTTGILNHLPNNERRSAIWGHYKAHANGEGHDSADIITCNDNKCAII